MLGRVIYENDRIEYTLEDIQSLLLKPAVAADTEKTQQHGIIESAYERNVAGSSDVMEKHMNEMQSGEVRYVNGYRIRKIRGSSDTSRTRPVEVNPYDGYKIVR
ncbi:MAG: hypothetical protein LBK53_06685 [Heliobacteriaceae bacterium]|jgi:hypothetical protein|nr:hypothetical protein [Heliobacteriaceae bacterium]